MHAAPTSDAGSRERVRWGFAQAGTKTDENQTVDVIKNYPQVPGFGEGVDAYSGL